MTYTDFIAAIQLGSSRLTGIVGKREANGSFMVIAYETEDSAGCIRRGCIRNVNETADRIKSVITKLQQKMPGNRIGKVFVGLGGQSVHSKEMVISRSFDVDTSISDSLIDELNKESMLLHPEGLDILDVLAPACYMDGRLELNPVGVLCSKIDAKYQQITARHSLRNSISEAVRMAGLKDGLAGIIVSPLALADAVLSKDEKEMGCALIDFGGGTTSISVYKHGRLLGLSVIPLGGNLITKDILNYFGIIETDAENIKKDYGQATVNEEETGTISVNTIDRKDLQTIELKEFYRVIAARQREIIENVFARIKDFAGEKDAANLKNFLRAGIFITGNAAKLQQINKAIRECMNTDVFFSSIRGGVDFKGVSPDMNPDDVSLGLLLQGNMNYINCSAAHLTVTIPPRQNEPPKSDESSKTQTLQSPETNLFGKEEMEAIKIEEEKPPKKEREKNKQEKEGLGGKFATWAGNIFGNLEEN